MKRVTNPTVECDCGKLISHSSLFDLLKNCLQHIRDEHPEMLERLKAQAHDRALAASNHPDKFEERWKTWPNIQEDWMLAVLEQKVKNGSKL